MNKRLNGTSKAAAPVIGTAMPSAPQGETNEASLLSVHQLDEIDLRIIKELQHDATIPLALLADRVGLSQSPCWRRVQKLKLADILARQVTLVDPIRLGLNLTAFVSVTAIDHSLAWRTSFAAALKNLPEVVEVWRVAGEVNYLLKVITVDIVSFDSFYQRLTSMVEFRAVSSQFTMERLVYDTALPIPPERLEDRGSQLARHPVT